MNAFKFHHTPNPKYLSSIFLNEFKKGWIYGPVKIFGVEAVQIYKLLDDLIESWLRHE